MGTEVGRGGEKGSPDKRAVDEAVSIGSVIVAS